MYWMNRINGSKLNKVSKDKIKIYTPRNVRLSMGLCYTKKEQNEYIKSLKRK